MKPNFDPQKKDWIKSQSEPIENDEDARAARRHGVDYYKTIVRASERDAEALAKIYSFYPEIDGEGYRAEVWALFYIVGDEKFAAMMSKQPPELRNNVRELFPDWEITTQPISKPKPYIKRHFPKTYKLLFAP